MKTVSILLILASAAAIPAQELIQFAPLAVDLNWQDNSDNERGFVIERSEAGGPYLAIAEVPADVTTYQDLAVRYGAEYLYQVTAYNDFGLAAPTNAVAVKIRKGFILQPQPIGEPPAPAGALTAGQVAAALEAAAASLRQP